MDISAEIAAIQAASQGSELRQPLVGALNKLNSGSLPAVTVSDVGKILKVGANGWEVGEKSGYMPVPTATKQITENGTYDVTDYANAIVSVSGGGGLTILSGTDVPSASLGTDGIIYLQYKVLPDEYIPLEYLEVQTSGPYIDTGVANTATAFFKVEANWTSSPSNNSSIFGAQTNVDYAINAWQGTAFVAAGTHATISTPLVRHKFTANSTGIYIDDVLSGTPTWSNATGRNYYLFANNYSGGVLKVSNAKIYSCKLYNNNALIRNFVPAKNSSNTLGMYDLMNDVFYTNNGSGSFIGGGTASRIKEITNAYLKTNGAWQNLIGSNFDDIIIS